MANRFDELALLFEEDIKWFRGAARHFEELASQVDKPEKSKWDSLTASYQERAGTHQALLDTLRNAKQRAGSNLRDRLIGGLGAIW